MTKTQQLLIKKLILKPTSLAYRAHIRPGQVKSTLSYRKFKNGNFCPLMKNFEQNHENTPNLMHLSYIKGAFLLTRTQAKNLKKSPSIWITGQFGPCMGPGTILTHPTQSTMVKEVPRPRILNFVIFGWSDHSQHSAYFC